ncbi:MAG: hypothetical protein P8I62_07215 [Pseudomonadales bacterium]|nr:hypothetical protein [Pseudomonadales bacterium]
MPAMLAALALQGNFKLSRTFLNLSIPFKSKEFFKGKEIANMAVNKFK